MHYPHLLRKRGTRDLGRWAPGSCGAYQSSRLSDRIFFRKDWDHLALLLIAAGWCFPYARERSDRAEGVRGGEPQEWLGGADPYRPPAA